MARRDDDDLRRYRVRFGREYFAGWDKTDWETVKRYAKWTTDVKEAKTFRLCDAESIGLHDLVRGFTGTELEEVKP